MVRRQLVQKENVTVWASESSHSHIDFVHRSGFVDLNDPDCVKESLGSSELWSAFRESIFQLSSSSSMCLSDHDIRSGKYRICRHPPQIQPKEYRSPQLSQNLSHRGSRKVQHSSKEPSGPRHNTTCLSCNTLVTSKCKTSVHEHPRSNRVIE